MVNPTDHPMNQPFVDQKNIVSRGGINSCSRWTNFGLPCSLRRSHIPQAERSVPRAYCGRMTRNHWINGGYPQMDGRQVDNGKSDLEMDDLWGYPMTQETSRSKKNVSQMPGPNFGIFSTDCFFDCMVSSRLPIICGDGMRCSVKQTVDDK